MNKIITIFCLVISVFAPYHNSFAEDVLCDPAAKCSHGLAIYGEPKYPKHFTNFEYTNPSAPKGGKIKLAAIGTFDSLNKHILNGVPAQGLSRIYDTLITDSGDEPFTKYGLIAHTIELAKDHSWVAFYLRPEAKFSDGSPLTADDVIFSFNNLIKKGHPYYRSYYREVSKVEKINTHKVKFTFSNPKNLELPLILGQIPILSKKYYESHDFSKTSLDIPIGSGPYMVNSFDAGKTIKYKRNPNYWGKDLPVNKGRYNFDIIQYDYYRDATVAIEAFKAGEFDFRQENTSKIWANSYDIEDVKNGNIIKEELQHQRPTGMQAFAFNLRKSKFADRKVRKALSYIFDFEWTNKNIFYNAYTRTSSYFENSVFASNGLPTGDELAVLNEYRGQLPAEIFNQEFKVSKTDGSGRNRQNLKIAKDLLFEAGWVVKNNSLTNQKTGEVMTIEFLLVSPAFERVIAPMLISLKKLGIKASMRTVDSAQYIKRLENFDFDMVVGNFGQSLHPGNEQEDYWGSERADINGTRNIMGIKNPVIDALIKRIIVADTQEKLVAVTKAMDRILLYNHYVIPQYHIRTHRIIYWNKFSRPKIREKYLLGLDNWWVKEEKM